MDEAFRTEWEEPELESLASLAENLVYRLPGCDETLIRKTLQEVAREFVADTQCLTSRQPVLPRLDGMCFPVPLFGGEVADVREVRKFMRRLRKGVDWNWPVGSGIRIAPHMLEHPRLRGASHAPAPVDAHRYPPPVNVIGDELPPPLHGGLPPSSPFSALVVERLPLFCDRLPKELLGRHGDAICSGVLGRIFAMTGKPWSDPQQAADERVRYDNFKSEARMRREILPDGRAIDMSEVL